MGFCYEQLNTIDVGQFTATLSCICDDCYYFLIVWLTLSLNEVII